MATVSTPASVTSQPYCVSPRDLQRAGRRLARGLRPLVLNAIVLGVTFVVLLGGVLALMDPIDRWTEATFGDGWPPIFGIVPALAFVIPWLLVYAAWRPIWRAIVRRRIAALAPAVEDLVATIDEAGIRIDEGRVGSNWLAWSGVTRLLLVGDTLVVARGTSGLVVSLEAIGGRAALPAIAARLSAAALAASDKSLRDAGRA